MQPTRAKTHYTVPQKGGTDVTRVIGKRRDGSVGIVRLTIKKTHRYIFEDGVNDEAYARAFNKKTDECLLMSCSEVLSWMKEYQSIPGYVNFQNRVHEIQKNLKTWWKSDAQAQEDNLYCNHLGLPVKRKN